MHTGIRFTLEIHERSERIADRENVDRSPQSIEELEFHEVE